MPTTTNSGSADRRGLPRQALTLLATNAVPKGLTAAGIEPEPDQDPADVATLANELLALWGRQLITHTTIKGNLMPPT